MRSLQTSPAHGRIDVDGLRDYPSILFGSGDGFPPLVKPVPWPCGTLPFYGEVGYSIGVDHDLDGKP
ncbi:MAG: hypothetical protein ACLRS8_14615 [Parabacteroides merdae]